MVAPWVVLFNLQEAMEVWDGSGEGYRGRAVALRRVRGGDGGGGCGVG